MREKILSIACDLKEGSMTLKEAQAQLLRLLSTVGRSESFVCGHPQNRTYLTDEIIERNGFKKVNNSVWRRDCVTLQNGYTDEGGDIVNKILTTKKAYKVCVNGKYLQMITYEDQIHQLLERKLCVG